MADCEICGRSGAGTEIRVEGSRLTVCRLCSSLGQQMERKSVILPGAIKRPVRMPDEMKIEPRVDLAQLVRKGREKIGITQEQLTVRLSLPSNTIRRIESGWVPPLDVLNRLQTVTKVPLVEGTGSTIELRKKLEKKALTIGDMAELK